MRAVLISWSGQVDGVQVRSAVGCLTGGDPAALDVADLLWAESDWLAECRWQLRPLRVTSPALHGRIRSIDGRGTFERGPVRAAGPAAAVSPWGPGRPGIGPHLGVADRAQRRWLAHLRGTTVRVDVLYPSASEAKAAWDPDTAELALTFPATPSAVLLRLT